MMTNSPEYLKFDLVLTPVPRSATVRRVIAFNRWLGSGLLSSLPFAELALLLGALAMRSATLLLV